MTDDLVDGLLTTAVSLFLAYCWGDNAWRCWVSWRTYRDARSLRALLVGSLLFVSSISFVAGSIGAYLLPGFLDAARAFGLVTRGMFLVFGIVTWIGWRLTRG